MKSQFRLNRGSVHLAIVITILAALGLACCSGPAGVETVVKADEVRSEKPRSPADPPAVDSAGPGHG